MSAAVPDPNARYVVRAPSGAYGVIVSNGPPVVHTWGHWRYPNRRGPFWRLVARLRRERSRG